MQKATISTHNGSVSRREHNIRNPHIVAKETHIDPNGHYEIWKDEKVRDAYERLFGSALDEYNAKQTRADRKIKSYYDHISKDAKKSVSYEMIVGIYAQGCTIPDDVQKEILKEFVDTWDKRNKKDESGLELIGAYLHNDELGGMHVHCTYVPYASGCYTKGLMVQSALDKALTQIGYITEGKQTAQIKWECSENQTLGALCEKHNILVVRPSGERKEHLATADYKQVKRLEELEEQNKTLEIELSNKKQELQEVSKELEQEVLRRDSIKAQNSLYDVVKQAYDKTERSIEIFERSQAKTTITGEIKRPETVTISKDDFDNLRNKARASEFVMKALNDLKMLGSDLVKKVSQTRIVKELTERIEEINYVLIRERDEREKMYSQVRDMQYWMEKVVDHEGHSIWDYYRHSKIKEQQELEHERTFEEEQTITRN